ncbi:hypothetical protein AKJ09_11355 [Labilithrix luteola]|uniref:Uncharacterized protein n=1 Tax=Labilithrix luteola TaxID=1391654 RepID=A0A0K1QG98_9BACT|nr:hypothetical protein AKJ09_11355 [Labilithrix luteola]
MPARARAVKPTPTSYGLVERSYARAFTERRRAGRFRHLSFASTVALN